MPRLGKKRTEHKREGKRWSQFGWGKINDCLETLNFSDEKWAKKKSPQSQRQGFVAKVQRTRYRHREGIVGED